MNVRSPIRLASAVAGSVGCALAAPVAGQIVTNNTEYSCSAEFSYTHNDSLVSTRRSIQCDNTLTYNAHYYNLASDLPVFGTWYLRLDCVDFSIWSSENPGNQTVFVRVYEDLMPEDPRPKTGYGSSILLAETSIVLPPSLEGVASSDPAISPGRSDGDISLQIGARLTAYTSIWVEIGHEGEDRTRFATYNDPDGTGTIGERGDHDPTRPYAVTWSRNTAACTGFANWAPQETVWGASSNRDMPIQVHFDLDCQTTNGPIYSCDEDVTSDHVVGVNDFLEVLTRWGDVVLCGNVRAQGDVDRDRVVGVGDFLAVLAAWGPCPNLIDECAEAEIVFNGLAQLTLNESREWTIDGLLDGPPRPPTNDFNDILSGPTTCGWADYGVDGIPGGFRWGDAFGVDASTGVEGGDVWFQYWVECLGPVIISTVSDCDPGRVDDTMIEVYKGFPQSCPAEWLELVACDDSSAASACGDHAEIELLAEPGTWTYLIRVAGRFGEQGTGTLTITPKQFGTPDCNENGFLDSYDICMGISFDCNINGIPDECETDCNGNGREDSCDLNNNDCDANGVPDECDPDCDGNGVPDACQNWYRATSGPMGPIGGAAGVSTLITGLPQAVSDVTFAVYASADLAAPDQAIDLYVDGWFVARFFETTGQDCAAPGHLEEFTYERAYFNILYKLDGNDDALIELVPVGPVDPLACGEASFAEVSVRYFSTPTPGKGDPIPDCNGNGIWDYCDINGGGSLDLDGDGVPDECGP